jgi:hypothetical protein
MSLDVGQKSRRETGQAFILGLGLMGFLCAVASATTVFMMNTGMTYYYKQKLERVTAYAAQHLATLPNGRDDGSTAPEVEKCLRRLKLVPPASYSVSFPSPRTVTVTLSNLRLLGEGDVLPSFIALSDTRSAAPFSNCVGYLRLEYDEQNGAPTTGPPRGCQNNQAFVPILDANQIDNLDNREYMFDTNEWPMTHVIYHGKYAQFPNYR